ncbi:MAG TPA: c-type cytochrome biogenesis protein CcsB [Candidatus Binataceae bacterium]|nr:c-type cytochrome biogenesis protein CcsB [Candidatus Binataceae bacterium]
METVWLVCALGCYALSAALFISDRLSGKRRGGKYAIALLAVGAGFHGLDLAARGIRAGNIPVTNLAESLSFLTWITALACLMLIVRLQMTVIGAYLVPPVTVVLALAAFEMKSGRLELPQSLRSVWLPIHVTLAILGYALFVLAASVSIIYLAYESRLKAKRPVAHERERMPSLEKLDRINYQLLRWGFLMLSLAIVSGAIWAADTWGHFWSWEPKESWSLAIWILYAALLESRLTVGWRGRRVAALTIVVFGVLVSSFLGVSLMYPGKHGGNFG